MTECDHKFYSADDWEGDPDVPGGVNRFKFYVCAHCGEETFDEPDEVFDAKEESAFARAEDEYFDAHY